MHMPCRVVLLLLDQLVLPEGKEAKRTPDRFCTAFVCVLTALESDQPTVGGRKSLSLSDAWGRGRQRQACSAAITCLNALINSFTCRFMSIALAHAAVQVSQDGHNSTLPDGRPFFSPYKVTFWHDWNRTKLYKAREAVTNVVHKFKAFVTAQLLQHSARL
jgi:hypothetical protein